MATKNNCDHEWAEAKGEIELTDDEWNDVDAGELYVFRCTKCGTFVLEEIEDFLGRDIGEKPLRKWK